MPSDQKFLIHRNLGINLFKNSSEVKTNKTSNRQFLNNGIFLPHEAKDCW